MPAEWLVRWVDAVAAAGSRAPMATLGPVRFAVLLCAGVFGILVSHRVERRGGRVAVVAVAAALTCSTVWPSSVDAGRHALGDGSVLTVGDCGVVV